MLSFIVQQDAESYTYHINFVIVNYGTNKMKYIGYASLFVCPSIRQSPKKCPKNVDKLFH